MAQNSTLENVFSQSFPGSSLFEVSLVKDTNPDLPFYKNKYFCFISLAPGVQNNDGGRGFDTQNKITIKTEGTKLNAFSQSLRLYARGASKFAKFTVFVDSSKSSYGGSSQKMAFCSEFTPNGKGPEDRQISISFKTGQNKPNGVFFYPAEALAVADTIEFIAKKCLELEFQDRNIQVGNVGNASNGNRRQNNKGAPPVPDSNQNNSQNVRDGFQNTMNDMASGSPFGMDDDIPF